MCVYVCMYVCIWVTHSLILLYILLNMTIGDLNNSMLPTPSNGTSRPIKNQRKKT